MSTFNPAKPLVTCTGRVELTAPEIEEITCYLDPGRVFGTADRSVIEDVLRRLLGLQRGTIAPRPEEPMPPLLTATVAGLPAADLLKKRQELKCWLAENPAAPPEHAAAAARLVTAIVDEFWSTLP